MDNIAVKSEGGTAPAGGKSRWPLLLTFSPK